VERLARRQVSDHHSGVTDPRDVRSRKRDQTHDRIFAAAMRLFAEHGYDSVSVAQIAAAAGVSVPTFYAHFPAKEQVVIQLPSAETVATFIARQPDHLPVAERMRGVARDWFGALSAGERAELLARWRVVVAHPGLRVRSAELERATAAMVLDHMRAVGRCTGAADSVVVNAYLSAVNTVLVAWAEAEGRRTLEELTEEAFAALRST
jgi:AcrR family transcriptional regulator